MTHASTMGGDASDDWSFKLSDVTLVESIRLSFLSRRRELLRVPAHGEPSHCSLCRARWSKKQG